MSKSIITVDGLSKSYLIGHQAGVKEGYTALREVMGRQAKRVIRNGLDLVQGRQIVQGDEIEEFWALKDVTFEIKKGEVVGIVGRNGAGKSTMLKVLSRITEPTSGRITLRGRVASLLEVGTGFHPELTGRENIFLNGAVLGMSKREIKRKFDEIVTFAEIESFLDTPVKRYSSGMYVRLAFSVASHLESEILVIDEVLAVGDPEFQKRCLGKMDAISQSGRTVIFVSHQLNTVRALCSRAILLHNGKVAASGTVEDVLSQYVNNSDCHSTYGSSEWRTGEQSRIHTSGFELISIAIVDANLRPINGDVSADVRVGVQFELETSRANPSLTFGYSVSRESGELLWWTTQVDCKQDDWPVLGLGRSKWICWLPFRMLNEGGYIIEPIVSIHNQSWICQPQVNAPVLRLRIRGKLSDSPFWQEARPGLLAPILPFEAINS